MPATRRILLTIDLSPIRRIEVYLTAPQAGKPRKLWIRRFWMPENGGDWRPSSVGFCLEGKHATNISDALRHGVDLMLEGE